MNKKHILVAIILVSIVFGVSMITQEHIPTFLYGSEELMGWGFIIFIIGSLLLLFK